MDIGGKTPTFPLEVIYCRFSTRPRCRAIQVRNHGDGIRTPLNERRPHVQQQLAGLILLVDACEASAASSLVHQSFVGTAQFRIAWMGSSQLSSAYDGCFTKALTALLRDGLSREHHPAKSLLTQLRASDLVLPIRARCRHQQPVESGFQDHDLAMFVGVNRAANETLSAIGLGGAEGTVLLELTSQYEPYQLQAVLDASAKNRLTLVVGEAGTGKSTLSAALRLPPEDSATLPVDAVAFLSLTPTVDRLAETLHTQLCTIPRFAQASRQYHLRHQEVWDTLSATDRLLIGTLEIYAREVTLVVDGLDQLTDTERENVWQLLIHLTTGTAIEPVRVIATGRPTESSPAHAHQVILEAVDDHTGTVPGETASRARHGARSRHSVSSGKLVSFEAGSGFCGGSP
jgi:hypothetical protein